jgi:hypothetical protein
MWMKMLLIIGSMLLVAGCYRPPYYQRAPYSSYEYGNPYSYCGGSCGSYDCARPPAQAYYKPPPPYIGPGCRNCNYGTCSY